VGEVLALSALPEAEEDEGGGKGVEDRGSGLGEEREDAAEVEELEGFGVDGGVEHDCGEAEEPGPAFGGGGEGDEGREGEEAGGDDAPAGEEEEGEGEEDEEVGLDGGEGQESAREEGAVGREVEGGDYEEEEEGDVLAVDEANEEGDGEGSEPEAWAAGGEEAPDGEEGQEVEKLEEEVGGAVGKVAEGLEEDGVVIGPDILNGGEVSAGGGAVNLFHGGGVMEQAGADELRAAVELEEIVLADSDAGPGKLGSEEDEQECAEKPKKEPHTG
jgi:hypothetical protein